MLVLEISGDGWEGEPAGSAFLPLHSRDLYCSVSLIFSCFKTWIDMIFNGNRQWYFPPRCLGRGAAGSGRTDDNEESLRKRFVTYEQATMPIIRWETIAVCLKFNFCRHFEKLNLVHQLDATKSPDEVFAEVEKIITASSQWEREFCWNSHWSNWPCWIKQCWWLFTMDYWIAR